METQELMGLNPVDSVLPAGALASKLSSGRPLRVKYGVDPTGAHLHLGHTVALRVLRKFQDLGHIPVIIIGDYTAMVGDPSGRDETRAGLTKEKVYENARDYLAQIGKVVDLYAAEIYYNSRWFSGWSFLDVLDLMKLSTVSQMMQRNDFAQRASKQKPVYLHECLYPLMQAWDSVEVRADIELGGSEQLFTMMLAREAQESRGQEPQAVVTVPILVGTDGRMRMGKSLNNYIGVNEPASEQYGKIMSIPDQLLYHYFTLLTDLPSSHVKSILENPYEAKIALAKLIVSQYHGEDAAESASDTFSKLVSGQDPEHIPVIMVRPDQSYLPKLLVECGIERSTSQARRLIEGGGFNYGPDRTVFLTHGAPFTPVDGMVIRCGKRRTYRIKLVEGDEDRKEETGVRAIMRRVAARMELFGGDFPPNGVPDDPEEV